VTGLGLLPIALGSGEAGKEVKKPMAHVILGWLAISMGLNLLVQPMLFRRFGYAPPRPQATYGDGLERFLA
jgi:Cu/Ag efflux pump CusA